MIRVRSDGLGQKCQLQFTTDRVLRKGLVGVWVDFYYRGTILDIGTENILRII